MDVSIVDFHELFRLSAFVFIIRLVFYKWAKLQILAARLIDYPNKIYVKKIEIYFAIYV